MNPGNPANRAISTAGRPEALIGAVGEASRAARNDSVGEIAALTVGDVVTVNGEVRREIKLGAHQTKGWPTLLGNCTTEAEIPKLQEDGVLLANETIASINPTATTRKAVRAIILSVHPLASTVPGAGANIVPSFL
jgi:hypothetical protein